MEFSIKMAQDADVAAIRSLLQDAALPFFDIDEFIPDFLVVWCDGKLIGAAGFEIYDHEALLRSFVIDTNFRGMQFGHKLLEAAILYARNKNISDLYLITETAEKFFSKYDFTPISRKNAPGAILHTNEFQDGCSAAAVAMFKHLQNIPAR